MKKIFFYIMLAVFSIAMVSCGNNNGPTDKNIVGTWLCKYYTYIENGHSSTPYTGGFTWVLKADNSFRLITSDNDVETGTWDYTGRKLVLIFDIDVEENSVYDIISLTSQQMIARLSYGDGDGMEFTFQKQ